MESSINTQKIQAMKNYKRAKLGYSLALYSLTSIITCFFFSSPFWFPSTTNHFFNISSLFPTIISFCFNAKCLFLLGNLIVIILVGESKLKQSSSSTSDHFYDEYVARSRSSHHKETVDGSVKTLNVEEKIHHHQEKKKKKVEIKINSMPRGGEEKKKGMRSCKSEVWGESGMVKMEKTKGKKEEQLEKIKMGMRSSKSAVWSESETATAKMEKSKGKKEEQGVKASMMNIINGEEKKMGMRSSKSAVWSERVKMERGKGKKEEQSSKNITHHQEVGMRSSRSAVWGESEIVEREKGKEEHMQMGLIMRSCRSESEIVRLGKTHVAKQEEEQQLNVLNKRVEDFIARVNNQRLLEAKIVDHIDS